MGRAAALLVLVILTACARPLSEGEAGFARALFGESIDTARMGVARDIGLLPPPPPPPAWELRRARVSPDACRRDRPRKGRRPPAAFVLGSRIHYLGEDYTADSLPLWPRYWRLPHALLLAHELTHVWQWQNRRITGYAPWKAALESWRKVDPYHYEIAPGRPFLSYGFEQQAAMVQDYVCLRLLRPADPKLDELRAVLAPALPLQRFEALFPRGR
ncbi:hypothetical protein SAMN05216257_101386 [Meinhardsimonia xiamenensis]|jgi:hypothetical protein|uniref:DUF4157 domain-containing protein n=1 Tax=Meinhardsimonia xiamenensis TaxID=990712 RepID=A0A1G8YMR5_9RHOB|nr:hypothetical protein [Meinhardsimonia xiamenensis]PRX37363.1 hypothetical protein LV81_01141 [Meinhardsimonia xiamenensis]SDK04061.1 hypothetical protein SAMN05216257_101386 [Meinhardsimonia xiamenensis]